jgi:PAS domain S-box-containing protein
MVDDRGMRGKAEEQARLEASSLPERLDSASNHELRVHQIELEMQNEELRRTQEELEISRERYFELYDLAPVAYCTLSGKGLILEANLAAATMLGVSRKALVNRPISEHILMEDQDLYFLHRKVLSETGAYSGLDLRMVHSEGGIFNAHLEMDLAENQKGETLHRVVISDITERTRAENTIKALLAEKELILKEVHHRIKNNMNTMRSLLSLQARRTGDAATSAALDDAAKRLVSMEVLYDKLYRSAGFSDLSVALYLPALVDAVLSNFPGHETVCVEKQFDDFILDAKRMQPLGIIVNELLTNVMNYAFKGRSDGRLLVSATLASGLATFVVQDNGNGIPDSVDLGKSTGFGLMLVRALTQQLDGSIRIERGGGTRIELNFKL